MFESGGFHRLICGQSLESDNKNPGRGAAGIMVDGDSAVKRVLVVGPHL